MIMIVLGDDVVRFGMSGYVRFSALKGTRSSSERLLTAYLKQRYILEYIYAGQHSVYISEGPEIDPRLRCLMSCIRMWRFTRGTDLNYTVSAMSDGGGTG